jgi:hypothetical protein
VSPPPLPVYQRRRCLSACATAAATHPPIHTPVACPPALPPSLHAHLHHYRRCPARPPTHSPAAAWRSHRRPPLRGEGASRSKEEPLCTHLPSSRHPPARRHRCRLETSSVVTVRRQQPSSPFRTQQQDLASSLTCLKQCCKFI